MKEPRNWTVRSRERSLEHAILSMETQRVEADNGDQRDVLVMDSNDWINIIALTDRQEVVFIRQFRFGTSEVTLEIPGGLVETGEAAAEAAARELEEETGYRAAQLEPLGSVDPNPAIQNNKCFFFLATDLTYIGPAKGDGDEEITVELVPLAEVRSLIEQGDIKHALVWCAFYALHLKSA